MLKLYLAARLTSVVFTVKSWRYLNLARKRTTVTSAKQYGVVSIITNASRYQITRLYYLLERIITVLSEPWYNARTFSYFTNLFFTSSVMVTEEEWLISWKETR